MIGSQPYSISMNPTIHFLHHKIFPSQPVLYYNIPYKNAQNDYKTAFSRHFCRQSSHSTFFLHFLVIFHKQKFLFLSFF